MTPRSRLRAPFVRTARKFPAFRPGLEILEGRLVPTTYHVATLADGGAGSLRQAILDANANPGADAIDFSVTGVINLGGTQLPAVTGDLTIAGPGALTVQAGYQSRVLEIRPGVAVGLSGLSIRQGKAYVGGGIQNSGTLSLANCALDFNSATTGGGIANAGSLTLTNCTLQHNSAARDYNHYYYGGGGIFNSGTLAVTNSTLASNSAPYGAAIDNVGSATVNDCTLHLNSATYGGGLCNSGTVAVTASTLDDNDASRGGAINNHGTMVLADSTLYLNSADDGGGLQNSGSMSVANSTFAFNNANGFGGGIYNLGTLALTNSTLTGNTAVAGGGIYSYHANSSFPGATTLNNTIVGGNQLAPPSTTANDLGGNVNVQAASSHNLIGPGGSGGLTDGANGNRVVASASALGLGTLRAGNNYGGPTVTFPLLPGSPAIDAGDNALAVDQNGHPLTTDQRGLVPRILGGTVDIGAFESLHDRTFAVTTLADEDNGTIDPTQGAGTSLREAINWSNDNPGGNTIAFSPSLALPGTIALAPGGLPHISQDLTIVGPGAANLALDTQHNGTILFIRKLAGLTVGVSGLAFVNGSGYHGSAGAILNDATLTLTGCTFTGNSVGGSGGAIYNIGTLKLIDSTLSGNSAGGSGGAIFNNSLATLSLANSTLSGNSATSGGGIFNSGAASLTDSTMAGNSAKTGGGAFNRVTLSLTNSTMSGNSATTGGGLYSQDAGSPGQTTLNNSIVGGNTLPDGATPSDLAGNVNVVAASSHNLIGPGGSGGLVDGTNGNIVVAAVGDLGLDGLADNGGPTRTVALLSGSPAIDHGDPTLAVDANGQALGVDQRGPGYVRSVGVVDIGAYEFPADVAAGVLFVVGTPGNDVINVAGGVDVTTAVVTRNGVALGTFPGVRRLIVHAGDGNDRVLLSGGFNRPARLDGGAGDDVLVGGAGKDVLIGGPGRDLLIGGGGRDTLFGDGGGDLLLGGTTDFDADPAALDAIMAEWTRADATYPERINHLRDGAAGGLNGGYLLNATTVHDDHVTDTLAGDQGRDWFFALASGPGADLVQDRVAGELLTEL